MKITESFTVRLPRPVVWAFFQDIPEVARCMPGAELTEDKGDGRYAGRVSIKLGPFNAAFEGEAQVTADPENYRGHAEGKGTDKRGGSRSKLVLDYALTEAGENTEVKVDADVQLSGPVAQFGRTGIISETASILIGQFVGNVEAKLAATAVRPAVAVGGVATAGPTVATPASAAPVSPGPISTAPVSAPPVSAPPAGNSISLLGIAGRLLVSFVRRLFGAKGRVQR